MDKRKYFFTQHWAKQKGKIFTLWIGPLPFVVISGFQAVKEGLINHAEDFVDRPETPFIKAAFKKRGIMFSNGHTWKQQRRFGQVTMRKLGLGKKGMEHQIAEEAQQLVETFAQAKGQPFDPSLPITNSVCNVISVLAFGQRFPIEDENFQKLIEALDIFSKVGSSIPQVAYEIFHWVMKHLPGPLTNFFSVLEVTLAFAKKQIENHKEFQRLHDPQDFIDFYLLQMEKAKDDPNSTYNEDNLAQCVLELFAAGTDTTATSLQWALLLITTYPDVQDKVQKEIEGVFGSSCLIFYQDRKKLPYTNAVIHEVLRSKYALLYGVARTTVKDVDILGFHIPKGTDVVPDMRSVLLDPEQWEKPEEFNPNHFLTEDGQFVTREEFLPFGTGARACIGEQLARIELFIFLTSLLRAFTFQLPEGVKELNQDPIVGFTMHPHPYKICAIPRYSR
ncbi:cytochrome P450 2J2-like isoform X2 [Hemicordylus capensis]|uniref:cytochrome P450 2J2-like isoform X2 n=1 Tax=Hemicordylus capensis TaxID=884348 RepID=UPI0023021740|nr:cytochrome P450 2J2-like isoform X2 [Hemicordylus capensis]